MFKNHRLLRRTGGLVFTVLLALTSCSENHTPSSSTAQTVPPVEDQIEPFADLRGNIPGQFEMIPEQRFPAGSFRTEDIITFTFNESTLLQGAEALQRTILENGKNPGLGTRALHDRGITGNGVSVAIIDYRLHGEHPEYRGKIKSMFLPDVPEYEIDGSMHGPGVASLLAGETIGTAPGASIYFGVVPDGTLNSKDYADAIDWVVATSDALPEDEKIRIISISAAPSGPDSIYEDHQELYDEAVARAQSRGMIVLDAREDPVTGICAPAFWDPEAPDDITAIRPGYVGRPFDAYASEYPTIGAPCGYRTTVEEYSADTFSYQYDGNGGLSWSIPYTAGVLALGFQLAPERTGEEMIALLLQSAWLDDSGNAFIDPPAFIEAVQAAL